MAASGPRTGELARPGANIIDKYELRASLGRGGMAEVFLAVHQGNLGIKKLVVVKKLRTDDEAAPQFVEMFLDEARLAARINHPNVVATYDVGHAEGILFIAMEYLEGQSLHNIQLAARGGTLSISHQMSARIIAEILAGLHHAHDLRDFDGSALRIVHRDVSPHNIFVTYSGGVKLLDFGVAKATVTQETQGDGLKGKIGYMAPEHAMGEVVDRRADVFAAGIVLWEMLAGRYLMTEGLDDNAVTTLMRLLNDPIPPVSSVVPTVDPKLEAIVAKALSRRLADRYQTALEMRDDLDAYLAGTATPISENDIAQWMRKCYADDFAAVGQRNMAAMSSTPMEVSAAGRLGQSGGGTVMPLDDHQRVAASKRRRVTLMATFVAAAALVGALAFTVARRPLSHTARATYASAAVPVAAAPPTLPAPTVAALPSAVAVAATNPVASAPAARSAPPTGAMAMNPPQARRNAEPAPTPKASASVEATPAVPVATGYLTLDTYPWTRVSTGGKFIGTTPIVKVELPVGTHVLTLENSEKNLEQTVTIVVTKGETISKRLAYE